jgi:hypothetical protein
VKCRNFAAHHTFHVLNAPVLRYDATREAEGGHLMTFVKPLNFIAVCAAFVFLGAVIVGLF